MTTALTCATDSGYEKRDLMTPRSPELEHDAKPLGLAEMAAQSTPVLPDPEVGRLQQVLEDVRFMLERGYWQAALGAARAALTRDDTKR
ncbi:MAG: hypothetical protein ACRDTA_02050 [Pseudonocardiaceae bacterium]